MQHQCQFSHFFAPLVCVLGFVWLGAIFTNAFATENALVQQVLTYSETGDYQYLYWYKNGKKTVELKRQKNGNEWENSERTEWFYQNDLCTAQVHDKWTENAWKKMQELTFVYSGKHLLQCAENYYDTENTRKFKTEYTYAANLLTSKTHYTEKNNVWIDDYTMAYFYDQQNSLDSLIIRNLNETLCILFRYTDDLLPLQQIMKQQTDSGFVNRYRYTFFYDRNTRKLTSQKMQQWELTDAGYDWVNVQNTLYNYDSNGNLQNEIYQYWSGAFWQNDMRYGSTFLPNGKPKMRTTYAPLYRKWRETNTLHYTYETSPRKESVTSQYDYWGGETGAPCETPIPYIFNAHTDTKAGNKVEILYTNPLSSAIKNEKRTNVLSVYPNPSNGIYYIDTQSYNILSWQLFSLSGAKITAHTNAARTGLIDITNCQNGVYVLQITTDNGIFYQKITKQN